jgi:hypothetical protein
VPIGTTTGVVGHPVARTGTERGANEETGQGYTATPTPADDPRARHRGKATGHTDPERETTAKTSSTTKRQKLPARRSEGQAQGAEAAMWCPQQGRMTRRSERTRSGRYQRTPTSTTLPGLHDDRPHGSAHAPALRVALRDSADRDSAHARPELSPCPRRGRPGRPALVPSCSNQPWTGQETPSPTA